MMDISNPNDALRILILEDTPTDAELMVDALHEAGLKFITQRVETKDAFQLSLETFNPNIILADCKQQPSYDGGAALQLVRETHPEMPVVMVTGALGEEKAVELLKAGAKDYVLKGGLVRLAPAVRRALADERSARSRKAAELKYRRLFEAAKDGILILDAKTGLILEANPFLLELLGYAQDELIGKALWEIGALEHIVANQDAFLTLKNKKYIRYDNLPLETKDGRSIEVEFISNVYMTGDLESIQCNIRDITERRRLQLALENNERRFRGLIENASDLVCVVDQLGCITYLSPSSEMMTGYRPDEALGRRFIDFIHPDDLPAATAILATDPSSPPFCSEWNCDSATRRDTFRFWMPLRTTALTIPPSSASSSTRGTLPNARKYKRMWNTRTVCSQPSKRHRWTAFCWWMTTARSSVITGVSSKSCKCRKHWPQRGAMNRCCSLPCSNMRSRKHSWRACAISMPTKRKRATKRFA
ncbi:Sporulation kinase E [Chromobacterium vaccinii]|nr:Sporulation kinase E [Chromobacterium vaccinii]